MKTYLDLLAKIMEHGVDSETWASEIGGCMQPNTPVEETPCDPCQACRGSGRQYHKGWRDIGACSRCRGSGVRSEAPCKIKAPVSV